MVSYKTYFCVLRADTKDWKWARRLMLRGSTEGRKAESSTRFCLVLWECGQRMSRGHRRMSATDNGMRMGDWDWRNVGRDEDLQLAYPLRWMKCPMIYQEVFLGFGTWKKAMSWKRGIWRGRSLWSTRYGDREKGQAATAGNLMQTWGWDWEIGFGGVKGEEKICGFSAKVANLILMDDI